MDLIREKLQEIEDQAIKTNLSGQAVKEWEEAREISLIDVSSALGEHVNAAQLHMTDPRGLVFMAFRWGYEVAVSKEREAFEL